MCLEILTQGRSPLLSVRISLFDVFKPFLTLRKLTPTSDATSIRSCGGFKTFFVNKVDPDQAALVRAAWSWSTMFAYGDMKCLIIVKWNLYARVAALNSFVNKVDLDQAAPVRTV